MTAAYNNETGADYDDLLDTLAQVCDANDPGALCALYAHVDFRIPPDMIST
jgi:hypothetical protein